MLLGGSAPASINTFNAANAASFIALATVAGAWKHAVYDLWILLLMMSAGLWPHESRRFTSAPCSRRHRITSALQKALAAQQRGGSMEFSKKG